MDVKKSPKADLESKKTVFMQIGLVVVLSIILVAFEWTSTDVKIDMSLVETGVEVEEEIIPITRQEEVKPPPPPPPAPTDILTIVDDEVELEEELDIFDTEMDMEREFDMTISDMEVDEETRDETEVFIIVEEMPEFPGGNDALTKYLASSVKYPIIAQENGIQGRVTVQFVINQNGEVTNPVVVRGVDASLDKEALRVVMAMPKWKPGKQRNRPVRVSYNVPINFQLQ